MSDPASAKPSENDNAAVYFVDRNAKSAHAHKTAFIEVGRTLTYHELGAQTARMAGLLQRHGLHPEDRIAMAVLDVLEFPIIFWGALKAGVIPVPLNTLLSTDLYETILIDSRAKAIFVSKPLLETLQPAIKASPWLRSVFIIDEAAPPPGTLHFQSELVASDPVATLPREADECAFWLYSSGSTGRPKGVRHVHASLRATSDTYGAQVLGIGADDLIYSAAKLFFAYGLGNGMTFPMSVGATTLLSPDRPTPDSVLENMARHRPTLFGGVPTLYAALLAKMGTSLPAGFDRLRLSISAGEALPAEVGERWAKHTGTHILDGVGSTEMLHIFLSNRPGDVVYGTSGTAVPGYNLRLVDEQGAEVGPDQTGELLVDGPSGAADYWNQREKSRSTFEGNWTRTGDKYVRRDDGRYIYCGRTDDMFKVSGIWVAPFEVEQALISHPDVLEAAVIAAKDESGLEKPFAFVVPKAAVDRKVLASELREHVKARVGKWKYPRWIEIVDELPKTATGKIQRFKLRAGVAVQKETQE